MLKLLRSLVTRQPDPGTPVDTAPRPAPAARVAAAGAPGFNIVANLIDANGLPVLDWDAVHAWVAGVAGDDAQAQAWASCEIAWLQHLGAALGPRYRLAQRGQIVLLSSLDDRVAEATIDFVDKTLQRIVRVLDGMARSVQAHEQEILIVFDDDETYYRYLAHYYPDAGEFAGSGGVFINAGCAHFATVKADLRAIEPVIAHELTHSCLSHLPLPAWLNEGLAVNTEQRLCPPPPNTFGSRPSPQQMHARHQQFWGAAEIQQFWSGKSFLRADEGNELSYDLARILVAQLASDDWARLRRFVLAADRADGGNAAAHAHLGVPLADLAAALLEQAPDARWTPDPQHWHGEPERGAF